ncbi:uncharacterized protein LOC110024626 [Phalaenopsis equestris]|uniref:uncharacterized protein LOC110024626 n=1 Tax=Phalaenopsis equestris TaxID=78828 RepID=UPI0009E4D87C|nr:uncharacterized protein LOC110024626 [Phalaenopsis equestris]XP_020580358.1 uncharacterized protein LOC110024626 [Phalaenopsis equestris]XP_020580359.1 uncharacterized protein LOC110024626 [Phalaenopsis equestris]
MEFCNSKLPRCHTNSIFWKIFILFSAIFLLRALFLSPVPFFHWLQQSGSWTPDYSSSHQHAVRRDKFLEVPQIIWGLNNQKIAFARACLTAALLNRTLLMPNLSASLIYKEIDLLKPISLDKIFNFERFNSLCDGFVRLGRYSDLHNRTDPFVLRKGSGRKWSKERDLNQLYQCKEGSIDKFEVIKVDGKHPFLWHDHWPVMSYARIFECLTLVDEIEADVSAVMSRIKAKGSYFGNNLSMSVSSQISFPCMAIHMRIEKDWMLHCKNLEERSNIHQICSSKKEIMDRVARIKGLNFPIVVYLAVADSLLEDNSILRGWREGLLPFEKKRLGVWNIYTKHPYLIQSAIDYEVCLRAQVFVGNSFSTFSSLVALHRTQILVKMGVRSICADSIFASYAYNILGDFGAPKKWMTDMSAPSLHTLSYGTNNISCQV